MVMHNFCSTIRMGCTGCRKGEVTEENNSMYGHDKMCLQHNMATSARSTSIDASEARPGTVHSALPDLRLPMPSFPDPAQSMEALPVPLGHSDPATVRTARPHGHVPTLFESAHHRSLNLRKVRLLLHYSCVNFSQYHFGSRLSCSCNIAFMPSSGLPSQRYCAWRVGDLSLGNPSGTSTSIP